MLLLAVINQDGTFFEKEANSNNIITTIIEIIIMMMKTAIVMKTISHFSCSPDRQGNQNDEIQTKRPEININNKPRKTLKTTHLV